MFETITNNTREQPSNSDLTESEYYRLLANERRRILLNILAEQQTPLTLTELATAVDARETNENNTKEDTRKTIQIALHHKHLPMMADSGLIDYNPEAKQVDPSLGV